MSVANHDHHSLTNIDDEDNRSLPTVVLVGRTNVGKSTLFNRLVGKRAAIVSKTPNTTRDWREGHGKIGDLEFKIIDTAGLAGDMEKTFASKINIGVNTLIADADVILLLIDSRVGVLPGDHELARLIRRRANGLIIFAANKAETRKDLMQDISEAINLGLGQPLLISAEHGEGLSNLYKIIANHYTQKLILPCPKANDDTKKGVTPLSIAIIGRPNVGKSTLVNQLIGADRLITDAKAGTTRDSIKIPWQWQQRDMFLIDTAGLRKKRKINDKLEMLSANDTLKAVDLSHIVVLLIDAITGLEKQDLHIAEMVMQQGRGLVIGVNKSDLITDKNLVLQELNERLARLTSGLPHIKPVMLSGLRQRGIDKLMAAIFTTETNWKRRISTGSLNRWLADAIKTKRPPLINGRQLKIKYITQADSAPPTFIMFASATIPAIIKNILNAITNDHALAIMSIDVFNQRGSSEEFELILLPLHERDRSDQLLGGVFTNYSPYWLGLFPALRLHIKSLELIWPNSDQAIRNNKQSMICSYDKGLRPPRSSFPDQAANHNGVTAGRHILDCIANRRRQETPLYLLKSDKLSSGDQASHNKPNLTLKKRLKLIDGGKKL